MPDVTTDSEAALDKWEERIPEFSASAVTDAHRKALAAGLEVMISKDGAIWAIRANGEKRFVKPAEKPIPLPIGTRMSTPRLRMFAGPNGSGKSTIKEVLPAARE